MVYSPSCALQLSIVLSRLSWNLLRICRFGEMSGTGVDCCWTDSLNSFRSISALLRSRKRKRIKEKYFAKRKKIIIHVWQILLSNNTTWNIFHFFYNYRLNSDSKMTPLKITDSSSLMLHISHANCMHKLYGCSFPSTLNYQEIIIE